MKLSILFTGAALALAATVPAHAQLAGAGNLITTGTAPGTGPSDPAHQSTTMVNVGGSTRGVILGANGGDLAPGVAANKLQPTPKAVSGSTQDRSAAAYVQAGALNGPTARGAVTNSLGAGPGSTYRSADVHLPAGSPGAAGNLSNLTGAAGGVLPK